MDRKTANRVWRESTATVTVTRMQHAFAQRVEEITTAACERRYAAAKAIGGQLSNVAFNLAQRVGQPLTTHDAEVLDRLRREWDAAVRAA